jgi:tetratricopeptide (TPR) repeat protein
MGVIQSLKDLGMTAHEQHDETAAGDYLEEALALSREAGDAANIATCLDGLGAIARMAGDLTAAHARYAESLAIRQRLGHGWGLAWSYLNLGRVAFDQGAYTKAREFLRESLALSQADDNQDRLLSLLDLFATLDAVQGWSTRAVQLAGAAAALRVASGIQSASTSQERLDRALVLARQSLGGEAFTAAWARGQTTTLERAIDVARRDDAGV